MICEPSIIISSDEDLLAVLSEAEVSEFIASQSAATPFDTWPWLNAANDALASDDKLFVVARSGAGRVLGWLALRRSTESLFGVKLPVYRMITYPQSDRHALQVAGNKQDVLEQLVRAVVSEGKRWSALILDEMFADDEASEPLPGWHIKSIRETPVFLFEDILSDQKPLIGKRGRRARNKLDKLNPDIRVWKPDVSEVATLLAALRDVESDSWKGREGVGIFSTQERHDFFVSVAESSAAAGELMVATIAIDGELASYRFGFLRNGIFYDYNFAYRDQFSNLSLGRVLLDEVVVFAHREGLRGVDGSRVGVGYENLLRERSEKTITHSRLMYFARSSGGFLLRVKFLWLKPLVKALRARIRRAG